MPNCFLPFDSLWATRQCLSLITLGDFLVSRDPLTGQWVVDLIIVGTKSRTESRMRVPLSILWPDEELDHLFRVLTVAQERDPSGWQKRNLMELICGEPLERGDIDERSKFLRRLLPYHHTSLHLPRANFANWLLIRAACARDRSLLERSWSGDLRRCVWFSKEMLDKFEGLVGSAATDSLELGRRLVGHSSTFELIASYCSSWVIQGELLQSR